jgi:hypothetical protein
MDKHEAQIVLIREILGLSAIHDPVECVRILYEQGRESFEKARGLPRHGGQPAGLVGAAGWPWGEGIVVCRGSLALGTGCGHCQKCLKERAEMPTYRNA